MWLFNKHQSFTIISKLNIELPVLTLNVSSEKYMIAPSYTYYENHLYEQFCLTITLILAARII